MVNPAFTYPGCSPRIHPEAKQAWRFPVVYSSSRSPYIIQFITLSGAGVTFTASNGHTCWPWKLVFIMHTGLFTIRGFDVPYRIPAGRCFMPHNLQANTLYSRVTIHFPPTVLNIFVT